MPSIMSQAASNTTPWATEQEQILGDLAVRADQGLTVQEAQARLELFGPNVLTDFRATSWLTILWRQLRSFIMFLLVAGAALSFALGDHLEGVAIVTVIVLNAMIGFVTELRAVRSTEALRELGSTETTVRRSGGIRRLPAEELVPGDIVLFEGGDVITADVRILTASRLEIDESMLTGESVPIEKKVDVLLTDTAVADRNNMLFKGTSVAKGSAEGVVVSTGMDTELGRITALVQTASDRRTPLEERIDALGRVMGWLCIGLVTIVGILGAIGGKDTAEIMKTAIALAVATVPEGLPIVATLALARGVLRMARRNALVEQLSAVETLGSTRVILTDKTGTLTENRMSVTDLVVADNDMQPTRVAIPESMEVTEIGEGVRALLTAAAVCSDAAISSDETGQEMRVGDPMEVALLVVLDRIGVDREQALAEHPRLSEEAFDPDTKMMATFHRYRDETRIIVKGAPEAVFAASRFVRSPRGTTAFDARQSELWRAENLRLATKGLRMLAVAERVAKSPSEPYRHLTLLGLIALSDPPRADVVDAIERCRAAGVDVVMVTGDQGPTAEHIAASVKIMDDADRGSAVNGGELRSLLDGGEAGKEKLLSTRVFARTDPKQKLQLLSFYQAQGEVVAMIGDGVNDAPALRRSDIGVAMGKRGTQVAREAADMILQDDRFSTIVVAIQQGRIIFRNIRSFVFYLLSCNLSEIITVGLAAALNAPLPILPMQILFLNLVTDVFPALALGVGDSGRGIMRDPPRPKTERLLTGRHWAGLVGYGLVMSAAVLAGLGIALLVFEMEVKRAVTVSFLILAGAQLGHVFNMASPSSGLLCNEVTRNPWIWGAIILCVGLLIASVYVPLLSEVLGTEEPGKEGWLLVLTLSLAPTFVGQGMRAAREIAGRLGRPR
ncbi:MAG: cation-transporting P-type ATPase [Myxococcales bacterium]|nr:cation-transporting P-type ATPase [Myxococcales bacterium]MDH3485232.1 cation-transporting P-type ATPase [Myxococcales bacterium]